MNLALSKRFLKMKISPEVVWARKNGTIVVMKFDDDEYYFEITGHAENFFEYLTKGVSVEDALNEFSLHYPKVFEESTDEIIEFVEELHNLEVIF